VSEAHSGLPHDMPEYEVYVPGTVKVIKARVYKDGRWWRWEHACGYRGRALLYSYPQDSQSVALAGALKHMTGCW